VTVSIDKASVMESEHSLYLYSGYGTLVDVTVKGQKSVIQSYSSEDIRVSADLSEITEAGDHYLPLNVSLPNGLTLSSLSSNTVSVHVDEKTTKTLDVSARLISGTVPEHYELGELTPKYNTITVSGPKAVLDDISGANIRLSLGSITNSMNAVGQIELVSASGSDIDTRYLTLSRTEMEVHVPLYTYKSVPLKVEMKYGYLDETNADISLTPSEVQLKGDPEILSKLDSITVATIDEKSLTSSTSTIVSDIGVPDNVVIADGTEQATIKIEHVGTVTKNYTVDNIKAIGAEGVKYEIKTESITVTLRGTLTALGKTTAKDITATVDLSAYSNGVSGSITEPLTISVATDGVYEIGYYTAQISIG